MKKRILALTVCLAMLFSLTAFAADEAISGGSSDVSVSQAESIESAEPSDDSSGSSSEETPDVSSEASSEESAVSEEESGGESSEVSEESGEESSEVSGDVSCTCGTENEVHAEDCPLYEAPSCTCGSEDGIHAEDCPLYMESEEPVTELYGETNSGVNVAVFGEFTSGTELFLADVDVDNIHEFDSTAYGVGYSDSPYVALDISLVQDGEEVQPEQPVTVSVYAEQLNLEPGDQYVVYHVHEGVVEELGTFSSDIAITYSSNSSAIATFEMDSFSYVIIVNGSVKINDVESFYRTSGTSTNKHYSAIGVYFTSTGEAHLLVGGDQNLAGKLEIGSVTVNGNPVTGVTYEFYGKNVTELKLKNGDNETDITNLLDPNFPHILDFNLGKDLQLSETFTIGIKWTAQGGHAIDGMEVKVIFDDGIKKTVDTINEEAPTVILGEAPEVLPGDVIIYKIEVKNGADSTQNVTGDVVDILPDGIFDTNSVQFSKDGKGTWEDAIVDTNRQFMLESNVTLTKGASKTYYVKATVLPTTEVGSYTNTSRFVKAPNNYRESTATVEVTVPPCGNLTIRKTGWQSIDENQSFIFRATGPNNFAMDVVIVGNDSVTIKDLPIGKYTVTELTNWSWRYEPNGASQDITLVAGETKELPFTNTRPNIYWLDGDCYCENWWDKKSGEVVQNPRQTTD